MREAERLGVKHERMLKRHWENAKGWVENGEKFLPNFITAIQQKLKAGWEGLTETEGMEVANELLVAATDTTASSLNNFLAAMALWPDVQRKAQEGWCIHLFSSPSQTLDFVYVMLTKIHRDR